MDNFKPKHFLTTFHCTNDEQGSLSFSELLEATDKGDLEVDIQTVKIKPEHNGKTVIASLDNEWEIFHTKDEWIEKHPERDREGVRRNPRPHNNPDRYPCFAKEICEYEDRHGWDHTVYAFLYDVKIIEE